MNSARRAMEEYRKKETEDVARKNSENQDRYYKETHIKYSSESLKSNQEIAKEFKELNNKVDEAVKDSKKQSKIMLLIGISTLVVSIAAIFVTIFI